MVLSRSSAKVRALNCVPIKWDHELLSCLLSGILCIKLPFFTHICVLDLIYGIKGFIGGKQDEKDILGKE